MNHAVMLIPRIGPTPDGNFGRLPNAEAARLADGELDRSARVRLGVFL